MNLFRKKSVENILRGLDDEHSVKLGRHLGVRDLTAFGVAAIVGAGIFSTIGNASASGGPGVVTLFLFTAIACGFAAFAYAEFASMVPVSGSAYTYSYVAFGEITAWIIGWSLIMEYGIGNITVAISWSDYFTGLMANCGWHIPNWACMDYLTAHKGYNETIAAMHAGTKWENIAPSLQDAYTAYSTAPSFGPIKVVADLPALAIIVLVTMLVYRGMRESRNASNTMVIIKLSVVLLVIGVGVFYINPNNWTPFFPNGIGGVLKGVSAVFFAYIGFDAISTSAEECHNPQRDLPRGMMWAIIICTVLYIAVALVLTGIVPYHTLGVGDPLAFVFEQIHQPKMSFIIGISAIAAMASVLLVFQMGQPRIWMSMSRDGLLPPAFSRIHPRFKTPSFATVVTGFIVAIPALFMNLTDVTDLCSIGTLFAFVLVCGGVLRMQLMPNPPARNFKTPYINSRYVMPVLLLGSAWIISSKYETEAHHFINNTPKAYTIAELISNLDKRETANLSYQLSMYNHTAFAADSGDIAAILSKMNADEYQQFLADSPIAADKKFESGWALFKHKIPTWIFILVAFILACYSIVKQLSTIPLLGMLCCLYMMSELGWRNWRNFFIWLLLGLVIYFAYSYKHSKLNPQQTT